MTFVFDLIDGSECVKPKRFVSDHKMIVADVEIRNFDRESNENVIDLSLEDDVPGKSQDAEMLCDGTQKVRFYVLRSFNFVGEERSRLFMC